MDWAVAENLELLLMKLSTIVSVIGGITAVLGIPSAYYGAKGVIGTWQVRDINQKIMFCEVYKLRDHATGKTSYTDELECYRKILGIK